ncbi:protein tyrosine phosphatase domain-containing protein 1 isoform X1 [Gymnodraco acuticeps]|uniref:Protein tyrosine phosphatase domain-containing protein 1 n=1 Tax=Gymnodraco acuticeps TaxID=8218 RepID=A0A6P8U7E8_GYMAC|nr:protein tyrosine phosphatase domain-containing protein 1 isoform X1 [Gymnodraco acuticeps]XP_034067085.1 protein tyrosine phosphatase domain-containing protein 1 isoform X1 [Gymnodraco acuticeps]
MASHVKTTGGALMEYIRAPRSKYTIVGEAIRYVVPGHMQCSIGCRGPACKYDNPNYWSDNQQAITGLYSSWITDHLLAMSRPSTEIIKKYHIIDQFRRYRQFCFQQLPDYEHTAPEETIIMHFSCLCLCVCVCVSRDGIKTVINLQIPGEHASCGNPLEPESGFSYRPEVFMENNIYFYNFGWSDYGVANLTTMLDIVKVMAFALQEGKIAIHCHAGLGRTGVLIACFLAYATRMTANQAILFVRAKRPNSIQTRGQLGCVRDFVQFLAPLRRVFSCAEPRFNSVTLSQYLNRQRHILHGHERKELRHLPKIVRLVSRLLLDIAENRQVIEEDILVAPDVEDIEMTLSVIEKMGPEYFLKEPRLPGAPTLPRHFHEPPIFYHRKSLSYSESDLTRLGSQLGPMSRSNVEMSFSPPDQAIHIKGCESNMSDFSHGSTGSLWQIKNSENQKDGSRLLQNAQQSTIQRTGSVGNNDFTKKGSFLSRWNVEQRDGVVMHGKKPGDKREEEVSDVPFITLQSELSPEARRLLLAQALAVDFCLDGGEEHKSSILAWQAELNLGGGWERLCMERDPFILTGLMWSWLEQLKEPVISIQEAKALDPNNTDAQTVLNTLDKACLQTLTCILDCMAHMQQIPEEVENAFLNRTIKAFTWMRNISEDDSKVYESMIAVLRCVLEDMRRIAKEQEEMQALSPTFSYT